MNALADDGQHETSGGLPMTLHLTSTAFAEGQPIPEKHTCDGRDSSPPLHWSGLPTGSRSLALIVDDPDAPVGTWVHWVLYGLAPDLEGLPENVDKSQYVLRGARQGLNDFRRLGYGGPCPPPGKPHRYFFKLYALDAELDLKPGATKKELLRAMEGHILATGQLMGTYARR
jgi:Raf kinase inhibitor-like YbhB/YbcL family protein